MNLCRRLWVTARQPASSTISRDDIDIVDICAPARMYAEIAIAELQAGENVLVEKTLANTVAEAEVVTEAARAARVPGGAAMIGFNYRRIPALALAKDLIREGRLGAVRHVRVTCLQDWLTDDPVPMTSRRRKEPAGSGPLSDIACHAIELIQHLTGQSVTEATGVLRTSVTQRPGTSGLEDVTLDDAMWATLGLTGGIGASIEVSGVTGDEQNSLRIEVYGSRGLLAFDLENPNQLSFLDAAVPTNEQGSHRILVAEPNSQCMDTWSSQGHLIGREQTFTQQIGHFLLAINSGEAARPSFEEAQQVQRVLAAIEESAANKSKITPVQ
jgi:predicted dehydrogenase